MYNVKILKYPSGWQIRTYSRPVGYFDNETSYTDFFEDVAWNEEIQDFEYIRYNPDKQCINPFDNTLATRIEEHETDPERSARVSMNRTVNKVYHLARSNVWEWFFTLTFDPDKVDSFDYGECVGKLSKWLNNAKRSCPNMKYIIVPELHKSGRFHFHGLFADCANLGFVESGHFTKDKQPIYNIGKYKLGFSTATKIRDNEKVTKYISKYITKDLCSVSFGKKRYWASRNLEECEVEEYIVEGSEMGEYIQKLKENCKWFKSLESMDLTTTYFEMGVVDE